MKKRIISMLACGVLAASSVVGLAACGKDAETVELTLWGTATQQETFKQMAEEFKKANPDVNYNIKVGIGEEDMAFSNVGKDPDAAADVYCYSNDQLVPLLRVGALARLGGSYLENVKSTNTEESVKSGSTGWGTADEKVYGYPYASDNGYFMYYDKSVVTDEQAGSLEAIISACEAANKQIAWALDVPWYTAGWFFTFGGEYSVTYDDKHNEKSVDINFDGDVGIKASKAIAKLTESKSFAGEGTKDTTITTGFATRKTAVAVSGTWNAKRIKESLGDDYGVCKLPTVTVDGETEQLYSFKGYKLFGVNPHSGDKIAHAHKLAAFLSSESLQKERFEKHLIGPTNKVLVESDEVKNDAAIKALNAQNAFAVEQTSVPSKFWEPLKGYGLSIIQGLVDETGSGDKLTYAEQLAKMVAQIKGSVKS